MIIPTREECYTLMREFDMLDNIVEHSLQVCRVSLFLTDRLYKKGVPLNRDLIQAASLLHDITKTRSFQTGERHDMTGEELLKSRGYQEVGRIVGQHVVRESYSPDSPPLAEDIVNYSDKRVLHSDVVTLEERMSYLIERYGKNLDDRKRFDLLMKKTQLLESNIFSYFDFAPQHLGEYILLSSDHECENTDVPHDQPHGISDR